MHRKRIFRSLRKVILPFSLAKLSKSLALSSRRENNINAVVNATRPWPNNVDVSTGSRVQTIPRAVASSFHVTLSLLNLPNNLASRGINWKARAFLAPIKEAHNSFFCPREVWKKNTRVLARKQSSARFKSENPNKYGGHNGFLCLLAYRHFVIECVSP